MNLYGATEATIALLGFVGHEAPQLSSSVPIGYPVEATEVLLLDAAGQPTPVRGEIALKSRFLALGYWNEPDLTRQAFLTAPDDPSARIYRTGDLGLRRPDGAIEYLGRKDQQVKIRGIRIEPVRSRLCSPGIRASCSVLSPRTAIRHPVTAC